MCRPPPSSTLFPHPPLSGSPGGRRMTAASLPAPLEDARPSLGRLTRVELRKMVDTRAGRWLLAIIALLLVAITVVYAFTGPDEDRKSTRLNSSHANISYAVF